MMQILPLVLSLSFVDIISNREEGTKRASVKKNSLLLRPSPLAASLTTVIPALGVLETVNLRVRERGSWHSQTETSLVA